ncbi:DUF2752 domain-containing protein [Janibacter cremeus]|uniref:Membrane associated rhomboid family serine protease n=1 Tax=Janibacter cremeus TaxID=1285192 RepID=A0A852VMI5_9MICO|nr:DUF2752 domain-containing protein [Janibacter cremeus]NYF97336.1 membrane associated rhomboid family serine protease [Janibacter cremeus]
MTATTSQGPVRLARGTRSERVVVLIIAAVSLVGMVIARLWPLTSVDSGQPTCLLRIFTGLPCPGCGMTRAWVHVAHGDLLTAFEYNLFGPIGMAVAAGIIVYVGVALVRRRPPERILTLVDPKILLGLIAVWMAYSVVRMVSLGAGQDYFALVVS